MTAEQDAERQMDELVEQYLVFLRGQGPEPDLGHLSLARRRAVRARLEIVDTMFGLDPQLPALEDDPVAIQLGLVPGPSTGGEDGGQGSEGPGSAAFGAPGSSRPEGSGRAWAGVGAAHRVLEDLEVDFAGQVSIEWQPAWAQWLPPAWSGHELPLLPLAQCSVLGDTVALFISTASPALWIDLATEPDAGATRRFETITTGSGYSARERLARDEASDAVGPREAESLALFLRVHPDVSSVGLVSHDGAHAAIVPAAACHRSIDPVRGWLEPGAFVIRDRFSLILSQYFERRLPRWERVAGLSEVLTAGDDPAAMHALVERQRDELLQARPRLEHKKYAQQVLQLLDPYSVTSLIAEVQTNQLDEHDFVQRAEALAGDTS